eukprot:PRCOL_00004723-RA
MVMSGASKGEAALAVAATAAGARAPALQAAAAAGGGRQAPTQQAPAPAGAARPAHRQLSTAYIAARDLTSGGVAGCVNVFFGHPFDTVKVVQQSAFAPGQRPLGIARDILRREGVRGLYKGVSAPLFGYGGDAAINYAVYQLGMERTREWRQRSAAHDAAGIYGCGCVAGVALSLWITPLELAKTQMQTLPGATGNVRETFGYLGRTLRTGGVRAIYRGAGATMLREVPGNGLFFLCYEMARARVQSAISGWGLSELGSEMLSATIPGGIAGLVFWAMVLPVDTLKTKQQSVGMEGSTMSSTARAILREGGPRAFFAGWQPLMARAFPANALQFLGYEVCRIGFKRTFEEEG